MNRSLIFMSLAALGLVACGGSQPWPMGKWKGESTLLHQDTMTITTSPVEIDLYYPGYSVADGVDDPRFAAKGAASAREITGSGRPDSKIGTAMKTIIDGVTYGTRADMSDGAGGTMVISLTWRPRPNSSPFYDLSGPVVYAERITLTRVRDLDRF